ncbi:MAG: APC family permease, partial [Deltaproteobacteria bacterium]
SMAFSIDPSGRATQLAGNKIYIVTVVLCAYWGVTFWNFRGLRASARLSKIGAFCGVIIPGTALVMLACAYLMAGNPSHLSLAAPDFFPDMSRVGNITFAASVLLAFAGMEMTAVHVRETRNSGRTYPIAIAIAAGTILLAFILGALSIAVALAPSEYTLQTGVTEALDSMLHGFGIPYLGRILALMMALGVIGSVNSWIIGPSKGLMASAEDGMLPEWFSKTNRRGMPTRILIIQAGIVSLLCLTFTLQPSVASAYFMLSDLTIQIYLIMYIAMFASAIRLRYSQPGVLRSFRVPFGNTGLWIVGGLGILGAVGCVFIGFFPPVQLESQHIHSTVFISFLGIGILAVISLPYLIQLLLRRIGRT